MQRRVTYLGTTSSQSLREGPVERRLYRMSASIARVYDAGEPLNTLHTGLQELVV